MPPDTEVLEGELLPDVYEPPPPALTLFGTDDPELVVVKAAAVSEALARVVRDRKLFARISGNEHVLVGGWTLLGSMLGVFPVTVWSRKLEDGWEARVEARTRDGAIVGAAESECLRSERRWAKADDYAIRSMAQTRATSKALRLPLGFVMELAGFDATPADEIPLEAEPKPSGGPLPDGVKPTAEQKAEVNALLGTLAKLDPATDWPARCVEITGTQWKDTTRTYASILIRKLQGHADELMRAPETGEAA